MNQKLDKVRGSVKFIFNNTGITIKLIRNLIIEPNREQIVEICKELSRFVTKEIDIVNQFISRRDLRNIQ